MVIRSGVVSLLALCCACSSSPTAHLVAFDPGASVERALTWLAAHQNADGRWDADGFMKHDRQGAPCTGPGNGVHDVGVTGLAVLAMLGNGNTLRNGPYKDNLQRAVAWLSAQQQANGLLCSNAAQDFIYDHAIAAYALSEACGLSHHQPLRPTVQKALDYLESHRNPFSVWRYQPRDNDNDTSVTTWAVLALCSGKYFAFQVDPKALKAAAVWFDQVTDDRGRAGYTKAGEPSSRHAGDHSIRFPPERGEAMTAAALLSRTLLGEDPEATPKLKSSADRLAERPPEWRADRIDSYYWLMGTMAMFQFGGEHWRRWLRGLESVAAAQRTDGNANGSWDAVGVWDEDGGRVYVTACNALALANVHGYTKIVK